MASRFLVGGGTGNWNSTTNWAASSGGASGVSFPIAGDDVFLDAASAAAPLTVNVASACATITCTGYTGTLTVTNVLTLTGNVTFAAGMTVTGAGTVSMTATATLTTGGLTIGCALTMLGTATYTLVDSFSVTGLLTLGGTSLVTTLTGAFTITANGGFTQGGTSSQIAASGGTPTLKIGATGTFTGTGNTASQFRLNLTIDAAGGTVTFANTLFAFGGTGTPTLTYVSGTIAHAGSSSTLHVNGASTLATNGMVWNKITFAGSMTTTLTNNLSASSLVTVGSTSNALVLNGPGALQCGGGLRSGYTSGGVTGTAVFTITGAGLIDATGSFTGRIANPFVINAPGAAITVASAFNIDLGLTQLVAAGSITTDQGAWTISTGGGSNVFIMCE